MADRGVWIVTCKGVVGQWGMDPPTAVFHNRITAFKHLMKLYNIYASKFTRKTGYKYWCPDYVHGNLVPETKQCAVYIPEWRVEPTNTNGRIVVNNFPETAHDPHFDDLERKWMKMEWVGFND